MNETAAMLEARLGLLERIRRVEHALAIHEQARIAAQLMRGRSHELGNMIQIVKLSALELARRNQDPTIQELVGDMTDAADKSAQLLTEMFHAARPIDRTLAGTSVARAIRSAVDLARPAIPAALELRVDLAPEVVTFATAEELEALTLAALVDARDAVHVSLLLRERTLQGKRWVELLRSDDRQHTHDGDLAHMFEPHSLLHVVAGVAKQAGGEVSLSPGRSGLELAVELPVAVSR